MFALEISNGQSAGLAAVELFVLVVQVAAIYLAAKRPAFAWAAAGKSKALWVVVLVVALFVPCLGLLMSMWYLFSTDRTVRNMAQLGPGPGFPGGPPIY